MLRIPSQVGRSGALVSVIAVSVFFLIGLIPAMSHCAQMSDADITLVVQERLASDAATGGHKIEVITDDGVVALSGMVDNILAKERAARLAETIRGVRSVVNNISVWTPERSDAQIRADVMMALATNPATGPWGIEMDVADGVIALRGGVNSWYEKQLAQKVAGSVSGVKDVVNEITVDYEQDRPDSEIAAEIRERLRWDVLVDDELIDISVVDGMVALSGIVGSAAEKRYAVSDAWVANVGDVKADDLKVESWARDERFRKTKYLPKEDEDIEGALADALFYDPRVAATDIMVMIDSGDVSLSGKVDNLKAKRAASQVAHNTVGVWTVENVIDVVPGEDRPDSAIAADVRKALKRDPYVGAYNTVVTVSDGTVRISGSVDSYFDKAQADDIAAQVGGVAAVDNRLAVDAPAGALVYDRHIDHDWWYPYNYDWYEVPGDVGIAYADSAIEQMVEDELWWSPFVDAEEINVDVENGVVTLTGTVGTWTERIEATARAYKGGAAAVENALIVDLGPDSYE